MIRSILAGIYGCFVKIRLNLYKTGLKQSKKLDTHVDFLKGTGDNLKQMGYTVKNRLELLNILGLD